MATLVRAGIDDLSIIREIEQAGRIGHVPQIPQQIREVFRTATELRPEDRLAVQAVIQRHVENAVSKTINLAESAAVQDVREAFLAAHHLDCKGVTVYREGSRPRQVLQVLGHFRSCVGEDVVPLEFVPAREVQHRVQKDD